MNVRKASLLVGLLLSCQGSSFGQDGSFDAVSFYKGLPTLSAKGLPQASTFVPQIEEAIQSSNQEGINKLLPYILEDIHAKDARVRKIAVMGVLLVGSRADGSTMIEASHVQLLGCLHDPEVGVANEMAFAFRFVKPSPPADVMTGMAEYLKEPKVLEAAGPAVIASLINIGPLAPTASATIVAMFSLPHLSQAETISLFRAVSSPKTPDDVVLALIAALSSSTDKEVQLASVGALRVIGPRAIAKGEGTLSSVAAKTTNDPEVRAAASSALGHLVTR